LATAAHEPLQEVTVPSEQAFVESPAGPTMAFIKPTPEPFGVGDTLTATPTSNVSSGGGIGSAVKRMLSSPGFADYLKGFGSNFGQTGSIGQAGAAGVSRVDVGRLQRSQAIAALQEAQSVQGLRQAQAFRQNAAATALGIPKAGKTATPKQIADQQAGIDSVEQAKNILVGLSQSGALLPESGAAIGFNGMLGRAEKFLPFGGTGENSGTVVTRYNEHRETTIGQLFDLVEAKRLTIGALEQIKRAMPIADSKTTKSTIQRQTNAAIKILGDDMNAQMENFNTLIGATPVTTQETSGSGFSAGYQSLLDSGDIQE
jgi:hypothetical protein